MRIGLITGEYPPMQGGVGAFTQELARELARQGHSPYVLTHVSVPTKSTDGVTIKGMVKSWNWASMFTVRQWALTNKLDILNIQYEAAAFHMAQLVHLLPRLVGSVPTVTTFHDLLVPYLFPKAGALRFKALLTLARSSDGVIVTNRQDETRLKIEGGMKRLHNIPIGSNISVQYPSDFSRAAWRQQLNIPGDATLVGYFGFMNATKGVDTLLQAIAETENTHLLLIGGRTGTSDPTNVRQANEIDNLIEKLGLAERVHWTGFVEGQAVSANLTACDVIALPYKDGVSLRRGSFMAAIAHGCPIITTCPESDLPEVQNREHVLMVPPDDAGALAAVIKELVGNPELRDRLGKRAAALAQLFTWDRIAAQTAQLFSDIIGANHR